jgi:hypothetical protein
MSRVIASRVIAIVAVGVSLAGCSSLDPYGDYSYGYYGDRPYGHYERVRQCREVRDYYGQAFLECRYVKRWKPDYPERKYYSERRYRDRDGDGYPDRRYREYYD